MDAIQSIEEYKKIPIKEREDMLRERLRQGKSSSPFITDEEFENYKESKKKLKQKNEEEK